MTAMAFGEQYVGDSAAVLLVTGMYDRLRWKPLFLTDIAPAPARQPALADVDPATGRARLSYRRAAEILGFCCRMAVMPACQRTTRRRSPPSQPGSPRR
jgi:hypothetical protein